ncbi:MULTISPECIES: S-layer homology domain-containing protein [unclassified Paenibacillus]|uniref:S-layer homology domain-containing protein n=1 Tax=unclassified Paenibacillus TaxID=185978 RepID=UPI00362A5064
MGYRSFKKVFLQFMIFILLLQAVAPVSAADQPAASKGNSGLKLTDKLPAWAEQEINGLVNEGIIQGFEDGTFQPDRAVTRAETAVWLARLTGNAKDNKNSIFPDVSDQWFAPDVNQAASLGIIIGYADGNFHPNDDVNRFEIAVMLNRMLKLADPNDQSFTDKGLIPEWASPAVSALHKAGVIQGYNDGAFHGDRKLTRAEAAVLVHRVWKRWSDAKAEQKSNPLAISVTAPDGSPLKDASVFIHIKGKRAYSIWDRTDAQGQFSTKDLALGAYDIHVVGDGVIAYQSVEYKSDTASLHITAEKAAAFTGKLVDKDNKPAEGVVLSFTTNPTFYAVSGADGSYKAYVLPDRTYRLSYLEVSELKGLGTNAETVFRNEHLLKDVVLLDSELTELPGCNCSKFDAPETFKSPAAGESLETGSHSIVGAAVPVGGGGRRSSNSGNTPPADITPPAVPAGLIGTAGNGKAVLVWTANGESDLAGYKVYVSADGGANWSLGTDAGKATGYTVDGLTNGTTYKIAVTAYDSNGNESQKSAAVNVTPESGENPPPDRTPPAIPAGLTSVAGDGKAALTWTANNEQDLAGYKVYVSSDGGAHWNPAVNAGNVTSFTVAGLTNGTTYHLAITAYDATGNESQKTAAVTAVPRSSETPDRTPPAVPSGLTATPGDSAAALSWTANNENDLAGYKVYVSSDGGAHWNPAIQVGNATSYTVAGLTNGTTYHLAITAYDTNGNESQKTAAVSVVPANQGTGNLPPDPSQVATPVSLASQPSFSSMTEFLYKGSNPVQTGVAPNAIEPQRAAVLRGKVLDEAGNPLSGVKITILNHSEWGQTLTRTDGMFDMAVTGIGSLTVVSSKDGYMSVQRKHTVTWGDYTTMEDVVLKLYDTKVTAINLMNAQEMQAAQGSAVVDADGTRTPTILVPQGTTATMKLADGTTVPLNEIHFRATEYTVGEKGQQSMPGDLPTFVGYTHAVELSADEAIEAGATEVTFNKPLYYYVDNYLNFPVGETVPVGYYDRKMGQWVPSDNGKVIAIISNQGGIATIDTDGDGVADDDTKLNALGLTVDERKKLAGMYQPGHSLWRSPVAHFTPWDCNWPYGPPDDATDPPNRKPNEDDTDNEDPCKQKGSIIGCENQSLGEIIPISGTSYSLYHDSERTPGYVKKSKITIPVSDATTPSSLKFITVKIEIAGKSISTVFNSAPNQTHTYLWDGKDVYGRMLAGGEYPYRVTVIYHYTPVYYESDGDFYQSFGRIGKGSNTVIGGGRQTTYITSSKVWDGHISSPSNPYETMGIAGWSLNTHHFFNKDSDTLYMGNGSRSQKNTYPLKSLNLRGDPSIPGNYERDNHLQSRVFSSYTATGAGGELYYAASNYTTQELLILRLDPTNKLNKVGSFPMDYELNRLAIGLDGSVYVFFSNQYKLFRKKISETEWTVVVGNGIKGQPSALIPDGIKATEAEIYYVTDIKGDANGNLYFIGISEDLYKVGSDGRVVAMNEFKVNHPGSGADNGIANKQTIGSIEKMQIGPDGSLYVLDTYGYFYGARAWIRRIYPDGTMKLYAGPPTKSAIANGQLALESSFYTTNFEIDGLGNIYFQTYYQFGGPTGDFYKISFNGIVEQVNPYTLKKVKEEYKTTDLYLSNVDSKGNLIVSSRDGAKYGEYRFYKATLFGDRTTVPSDDGVFLYQFDADTGRHTDTLHSLTGTVVESFGYDTEGRLQSIEDRDGNKTIIERDAQGLPTAIVAPGGQRTSLAVDGSGQLKNVTLLSGDSYKMSYDASGLLTQFTDPKQQMSEYEYDSEGMLIQAKNAAEGVKTLARTKIQNGYQVVFTDPENKKTVYEVKQSSGNIIRTTTDPAGAKIKSTLRFDGSQQVELPDGTVTTKTIGEDPRYGKNVPMLVELKINTPDGRTTTVTETRTFQLNQDSSLKTLTHTYKVNGNTSTVTFDSATKTYTETSAEGKVVKTYLDAADRVFREEYPGQNLQPVQYEYDAKGRLRLVKQGEQLVQYAYDDRNRLVSMTDAFGSKKEFTYNDADQLTSVKSPNGQVYSYNYDSNDQLTGLTMPNGMKYNQQFNELGQFKSFAPDGVSPWVTLNYDNGERLNKASLPSGRNVDYGYESSGGKRITAMNDPDVKRSFTYSDATDRVSSIVSEQTGNAALKQTIEYTYSGSDVKKIAYKGKAAGTFDYTYDNLSNLTNIHMSVTQQVYGNVTNVVYDTAIGWNKDNQMTRFGPFNFTLSGPGGRAATVSDGALSMENTYDDLGRLQQRKYLLNGRSVYGAEYDYDSRGFVTDRTVSMAGGAADLIHYEYDRDGQLLSSARAGGGFTETYSYDVNKNRTSRSITGKPEELSLYDANDLLKQAGVTAYVFDADGFLKQRGSDRFRYGVRGELLEATVSGSTYTYTYDALGRRTARDDGTGKTIQYLYGHPHSLQMLTASVGTNGEVTNYYYNEDSLLIGFERGGQRYYVITDNVGTPELVLNAAGAEVKKLRYDSYGVLLSDSNPAFELLIGFAGGLEDRATGLVRFGARDYDSASGRWTARDPVLFESGQANLYAYVNNNPVLLRDPCGMFCVGASAYEGIGGGGKVCVTDEGFSSCLEAGFGVGGGLEISPFEDLSKDGISAELTGKLAHGPASLTFGVKASNSWDGGCPEAGGILKAELGPAKVDLLDKSKAAWKKKPGTSTRDMFKNKDYGGNGGNISVRAEAALKVKGCQSFRW